MGIFKKTTVVEDDEITEVRAQYVKVLSQLSKVEAQLAALREERDNTREVNGLKRQIATLTIEKDKMEEDNARKVREAEHKAGLLLTGQEQEVANARRETVLEVREGNLKAERDRFEQQMKFRDEHFQLELSRLHEMTQGLLDLVPKISVELSGGAAGAVARPKAPASRKPSED